MSYDFADRLIELRRSKNLSQEELAKRLGVSRQAISKWERAESTPDIANLMALADLYDTTLDNLVRGVDNDDQKQAAASQQTASDDACASASDESATNAVESVASNSSYPPPPENAIPVRPPAPEASTVNTAHTTSPTPGFSPADQAPSAQAAYAPNPMPNQNPGSTPGYVAASAPAPTTTQPATQLEKNPLLTFPYPLFVVLAYLILGFCFNLWHPGWIIFFTIPFYYWIISVIKHDPEYISRHTVPRQ